MSSEQTSIQHFTVENHSALLIGESRSGKTTFKRLLIDSNYCTQMEVLRGTKNPETERHLFKVNNKFINLTIVDTPGFGEVSENGSRSDLALRNMMSECIKKDITRVSMILITLDGQGGFTKAKLDMVKKICMFLGKDAMKNVYLLVTHFEGRNETKEKEWINTFKNTPSFGFLRKAINKFIFTGALNETQHANVKTRDQFIIEQSRRTNIFFTNLTSSIPYNILAGSNVKKQMNMLVMVESIASRATSLIPIFAELEQSRKLALNARVKLSNISDNNNNNNQEIQDLCQKYSWVAEDGDNIKFNNQTIDKEHINTLLQSQQNFANKLETLYNFVITEHERYVEAGNTLNRELEELEWSFFDA